MCVNDKTILIAEAQRSFAGFVAKAARVCKAVCMHIMSVLLRLRLSNAVMYDPPPSTCETCKCEQCATQICQRIA
jgi:hypothetical protein